MFPRTLLWGIRLPPEAGEMNDTGRQIIRFIGATLLAGKHSSSSFTRDQGLTESEKMLSPATKCGASSDYAKMFWPWAVEKGRLDGPCSSDLCSIHFCFCRHFLWRLGERTCKWEDDYSTGIDGFDVRGEGIPNSKSSVPKGEN